MLKVRRQAANEVAERLFAAEAAVSEAVLKVATLVGSVEKARTTANLSLLVGSEAGLRTINSLMALGTAKQELVDAHRAFDDARCQIGLGAVAFGEGGGDKPSEQSVRAIVPPVRVVAA